MATAQQQHDREGEGSQQCSHAHRSSLRHREAVCRERVTRSCIAPCEKATARSWTEIRLHAGRVKGKPVRVAQNRSFVVAPISHKTKRPRMSIAVIAGNLAFFPSLEMPLTSVLSTQFFTLYFAISKCYLHVPQAVPLSMCHPICVMRGFWHRPFG